MVIKAPGWRHASNLSGISLRAGLSVVFIFAFFFIANPVSAETLLGNITATGPETLTILIWGPCDHKGPPLSPDSSKCPRSDPVCLPRVGDELSVLVPRQGYFYREVARGKVKAIIRNSATASWHSVNNGQPKPGHQAVIYSADPTGAGINRNKTGPPGCGKLGGEHDWRFRRSQTRPPWSEAETAYDKGHSLEFPQPGQKSDYARASVYYEKAAEKGQAKAAFRLYYIYLKGKAGEKSKEKAIMWLKKTAKLGHSGAQAMLGDYYAPLDRKRAVYWYERAARQGNIKASLALKKLE